MRYRGQQHRSLNMVIVAPKRRMTTMSDATISHHCELHPPNQCRLHSKCLRHDSRGNVVQPRFPAPSLSERDKKEPAEGSPLAGSQSPSYPIFSATYPWNSDRVIDGAELAIDRACTPNCCFTCKDCSLALSVAMSASTRLPIPAFNVSTSCDTKVDWMVNFLEE